MMTDTNPPSTGSARRRQFSLQPLRRKIQEVRKRKFGLPDLSFSTEDRQFFHESSILSKNFRAAGQDCSRTGSEPVAYRRDRPPWFEIMRPNVLPCDIRNELLKSVFFAIKNEARL